VQDYLDRTGLPISTIRSALDEAERKGLITQSQGRVTPTERGFDFLSDLQELFLAPE
jgi:oxygen-independent coproporphyrinogen-3 oxidase